MAVDGTISVAVVDDHPLFRRGIISLLETLERIEVAGSAATVAEALALVEERRPDVWLLYTSPAAR